MLSAMIYSVGDPGEHAAAPHKNPGALRSLPRRFWSLPTMRKKSPPGGWELLPMQKWSAHTQEDTTETYPASVLISFSPCQVPLHAYLSATSYYDLPFHMKTLTYFQLTCANTESKSHHKQNIFIGNCHRNEHKICCTDNSDSNPVLEREEKVNLRASHAKTDFYVQETNLTCWLTKSNTFILTINSSIDLIDTNITNLRQLPLVNINVWYYYWYFSYMNYNWLVYSSIQMTSLPKVWPLFKFLLIRNRAVYNGYGVKERHAQFRTSHKPLNEKFCSYYSFYVFLTQTRTCLHWRAFCRV